MLLAIQLVTPMAFQNCMILAISFVMLVMSMTMPMVMSLDLAITLAMPLAMPSVLL